MKLFFLKDLVKEVNDNIENPDPEFKNVILNHFKFKKNLMKAAASALSVTSRHQKSTSEQ